MGGTGFVAETLYHTGLRCSLLSFKFTIRKYFKGVVSTSGTRLGQPSSRIFEAIALNRLGEVGLAMDAFKEAYNLCYHNNIIMPFVECGAEMRSLIESLLKNNNDNLDMDWINIIYSKASSYAKRRSSMVKEYAKKNKLGNIQEKINFSKREKEILRCLAQGLTREEIGVFYNLSTSTVKKHITSVYNKLGAINRGDAIYIATTEKLL